MQMHKNHGDGRQGRQFPQVGCFFLETISWLLKGERELGQLSKA